MRIGSLNVLEKFYCGGNNLTGQIPFSIGNLSKLQTLGLSENDFSGTLPIEMGELRKLTELFLDAFSRDSEGIGGPLLPFSNSPDLTTLFIASNSLSGPIPASLLAGVDDPMQEISINLKSNILSGTVPESLSRFKRLQADLAGNRIEGIDPILCEQKNWMGGAVEIYQCNAILCPPGYFNQHGRQSSDDAPCDVCEGISSMPYYGALQCGSKEKIMEREILEKFYHQCGGENWKNTENWLDPNVDYCDWYGINCHEDTFVNSILLGSNNVVGTPPKEIFQLTHLKWLWLYSNPMDFNFDGIGDATELISLLLDSTILSSISGVGKAVSLLELDLRFNKLTGAIPNDDLETLVNIESLSLSDNVFTGEVPTSLKSMTKLKKLRLGSNRLTGTLPDFAEHSLLKSIDLSNNQLTGSIPVTLLQSADPSQEIFLDLSTNLLTGAIPGALARFNTMSIYLRNNQISTLHPDLCTKEEWMEGDVGNFDCDGLLCAPGTFSDKGRQSKAGLPCRACEESLFYGSTTCGGLMGTDQSSGIRVHISGTKLALAVVLGLLVT